MAVLLPLLIVSIFGGFMFLQASTLWYKKEIPRAILYAAGAMFLVMATTFYSTVKSVEFIMTSMLNEYGVELRQATPPEQQQPYADIPPYQR